MSKENLAVLPLPADTRLADIEEKRQEYRYRDGLWIQQIRLLGLTPESMVNDVRNKAIELRTANQNFGVNTETTRAIQDLLRLTGDCMNDFEFNSFFLRLHSLESIDRWRSSKQ